QDVTDWQSTPDGYTLWLAGKAIHPRRALQDNIVARSMRLRSLLAVAGDRAIDEAWAVLVDRIVAKAQRLKQSWTEVLHQHIPALQQPPECFAPALAL